MNGNTLTKEMFVERARKKHGYKYGYDNVVYVANNKHVFITCPKHGDFRQTPALHTSKLGCPECGKEARKTTAEKFIAKARLVHGDKYNYDQVEYKHCNFRVIIVCPEHGNFLQHPSTHLRDKGGCPKCKQVCKDLLRKKLRSEKRNSLYGKRAALVQKVRDIKEQMPCKDCGVSYPHYVMDFDHIGTDKVSGLSELCRGASTAWEKIQAEIDKCELVCSNCHRARSWFRMHPPDA